MTQAEINEAINAQESIILDREARLTSTDYIAAKIAERQQWRDDINAAKAEIERLEALEPDNEDAQEMEE